MAKFYGKAEQAANRIMDAFKAGDLPAKLAPIFIQRADDVPCRRWSWSNQLLTALAGTSDARGYRQWQDAGRYVKKGAKSFLILAPLTRKIERTDPDTGETEKRPVVYGFKAIPVFRLEDTDGKPLKVDTEAQAFLDGLPLREVAEHWGLSVESFNGKQSRALGWYRHGNAIAVGVENLATWCHEFVHAADDKRGQLTERGQHWRSETVAELGAAILLECLGHETDSDRGGCWDYVSKYAEAAGIEPITACEHVLKRTCEAVSLILDTAAKPAEPVTA